MELILRHQHFDPPKVISGGTYDRLGIFDSSGIHLEGVTLRHERAEGEFEHTRPFEIVNSSDIKLSRCDIASDDDRDHEDDVYGLTVTNSHDITLEDSQLHDLVRAGVFLGVVGLRVLRNRVKHVRSDAFDFIGVEDVEISDNEFSDFMPTVADHADAIQFWGDPDYPVSRNVKILRNTAWIGEGELFQYIFIESRKYDFENFEIADNVGYIASVHGISVYRGKDFIINRNTLLTVPGFNQKAGIIIDGQLGPMTAEKNIANHCGVDGDNLLLTPEEQAAIWKGPFGGRHAFPQHNGYGADIKAIAEALDTFEISTVIGGIKRTARGVFD